MILEDNAKVERVTFPSLSELGKDLEMRENPVVSTVLLGFVLAVDNLSWFPFGVHSMTGGAKPTALRG